MPYSSSLLFICLKFLIIFLDVGPIFLFGTGPHKDTATPGRVIYSEVLAVPYSPLNCEVYMVHSLFTAPSWLEGHFTSDLCTFLSYTALCLILKWTHFWDTSST